MEDVVHHKKWKENMWNRMGDIHNHDGKVEVEETLGTHPLDKTYMNVKVCCEAIHKNHDMMHDMHQEKIENAWKDVVQNHDMCHSNPCFLPICT